MGILGTNILDIDIHIIHCFHETQRKKVKYKEIEHNIFNRTSLEEEVTMKCCKCERTEIEFPFHWDNKHFLKTHKRVA